MMHVCTIVCGQTFSTTPGKPSRPSQTTKNTSRTPRLFRPTSTLIQNFAPSPPPVPIVSPSTSLRSSRVTPMAAYTGRLATWPSRTFTTIASMKIAMYTGSSGRCDHSSISAGDLIGNPGHRFLRHRRAINIVEMRRDLTRRETPRVQRQHNLIDVTKTTLPFLHNRRAQRALPIPRDSDLHLAHRVRNHRLRPT